MTTATLPPRRVTSLDGLRGMAALVVVVHHSLLVIPGLPDTYFGQPTPDRLKWFVLSPLHVVWAGGEAVHIFFILSGLVLTIPVLRSAGFAWRAYYPSRLIRLYVPVIVSVALAFLLSITVLRVHRRGQSVWMDLHDGKQTLVGALRDGLLIRGSADALNTPLWSLQWEVLFSLLLPLFVVIAVRAGKDGWILVLGVIAYSFVGPQSGWMLYLPMFLVGCVIATRAEDLQKLADRIYAVRHPGLVWAALFLVALLGLTSYWWTYWFAPGLLHPVNPFELASAALFVLLAMFCRGLAVVLDKRITQWLGTVSFSVYLVHEPIVVSLAQLVPIDRLWLVPVVGVPLSFLIGWIFFLVVEAPAHRLAQMVNKRLKRASNSLQVTSVAILPPSESALTTPSTQTAASAPSPTRVSLQTADETRTARHGRGETSTSIR